MGTLPRSLFPLESSALLSRPITPIFDPLARSYFSTRKVKTTTTTTHLARGTCDYISPPSLRLDFDNLFRYSVALFTQSFVHGNTVLIDNCLIFPEYGIPTVRRSLDCRSLNPVPSTASPTFCAEQQQRKHYCRQQWTKWLLVISCNSIQNLLQPFRPC